MNTTDEVMEQLDPVIMGTARYYWSRLPSRTMYDISDLMNEAMLVLMSSLASYDSDRGAEFKTHFINNLNSRFSGLVYEERCRGMASLEDRLEDRLEPWRGGSGSNLASRLRGLQHLSDRSRVLRRNALSPSKKLLKRVMGRYPIPDFEIRRAFDMSKKDYSMAISEILAALKGDI